jgi:ribonuclease HI
VRETHLGKLYVVVVGEEGEATQILGYIGHSDPCARSEVDAISGLCTEALRAGVKLRQLAAVLGGIKCEPHWYNGMQVESLADGFSQCFEEAEMAVVTVYTDGSCLGNPGPGGWAAVVLGAEAVWVAGREAQTTNNRMEIKAAIEGVRAAGAEEGVEAVVLWTDSQYVVNCAEGTWSRKKNHDLWREWDEVVKEKRVTLRWVRGHDGDLWNTRVDAAAKNQALMAKEGRV